MRPINTPYHDMRSLIKRASINAHMGKHIRLICGLVSL